MDDVYARGQSWSARGAAAAWGADGDGVPEPHFIDVTFAPILAADGRVEGITLTVEVVDERVAAEQARERAAAEAEAAREHLTRVIAQAPVAMYIARGRAHVFEAANEPWYSMAGKRPEEVIGRPVREVFPGFHPSGDLDVIDNVYDSGQPFSTAAYPLRFDPTATASQKTTSSTSFISRYATPRGKSTRSPPSRQKSPIWCMRGARPSGYRH